MQDQSLSPPSQQWAVVDVETSGLYPHSCRVLSVAALRLDSSGRPEGRPFTSLINADCDPGPVHIHGLTAERLAGAPRFVDIVPQLLDVLDGRVLVAHNAAFDYGFLAAETYRAGVKLPVQQRLCTLALSRRLGLDVTNHRLSTLASYWGVQQQLAHDAYDDAFVLSGIFAHSMRLAAQLDMPLPLVPCDGRTGAATYPAQVVKTPCPWRHPGPLRAGEPLQQGMKIVITGDTRLPREELVGRITAAGLEVLNSVSRFTNALICNRTNLDTRKAARARTEGTLVLSETTLLQLLGKVLPGEPKKIPTMPRNARPLPSPKPVCGPLSGHRVLVLGGPHQHAAEVRAEITARGGAAAVNLSANVTDLILLDGSEHDIRLPRAVAASIAVHRGPIALGITLPGVAASPVDGHPVVAAPSQAWGIARDPEQRVATPVLSRGAVIDLPDENIWTINVAWRADALVTGTELDVVAFLVDETEQVVTDEDFVFYNAPISQDGAVALSIDGNSEQSIRINLDLLGEYCTRVIVAGALSGTCTFGNLGAVTISVDGQDSTAAAATLDAGTSERTMLLIEIYRRADLWRARAIGQGYDNGLGELATLFGVDVA